jgi:hypothetical protein
LKTAMRAISTADASWSKLLAMLGAPASAKLRAIVVTRRRICPDACW